MDTAPVKLAYAVLVFRYKHRKDTDFQWGVLCNGKRLMPSKLAQFEGTTAFFGGKIEDGETPEDAMERELREELAWNDEDFDTMGHLIRLDSMGGAAFFAIDIGVLDEDRLSSFASGCAEGIVDPVLESAFADTRWVSWPGGPDIGAIAQKAVDSIKAAAAG